MTTPKMKSTPIDQSQIEKAVGAMLSLLSDERTPVPASVVEAIVSGKSLLRGLLSGELVACKQVPDESPEELG